MNNHKLHLLPLFILITGLVTLTASCKKKDMSLKLNEPRNIRGVVSYKRSFPDLNDKHLAVAQAVGICPPEDRDAAEKMKEQLIQHSCWQHIQGRAIIDQHMRQKVVPLHSMEICRALL